jgi:putative DNA primase/helicase
MSVATNFDDVIDQLQKADLLVSVSELVIGKRTRCRVKDGGKEKRGWYQLYELPCSSGSGVLIVGSYGVFWGAENLVQKITIKRGEQDQLTAEQREAIKKRIAEDRKRSEREAVERAAKAAKAANSAWGKCSADGHCDYLTRKQVKAHGVRFSPSGNMVIPMLDDQNNISGLQVIYGDPEIKKRKQRDKDFWPAGLIKKGRYFLIGGIPRGLILVCEGYATGASLHEATGLPVAVAFDAGNLLPVAESMRKRFKRVRVLICADDDYRTEGNPGLTFAQSAALVVEGSHLAPVFAAVRPAERKGPTDFNDLHVLEGLHIVRKQLEAHLTALKWSVQGAKDAPLRKPGGEGSEAKETLKGLLDVEEACERYSLIYGAGGTFFDHQEHILVPKSDVMDVLVDHGWREWKLRADRKVVRLTEVGFDPAGQDKQIKCNLWGGWPTKAQSGRCEALIDLLRYLCQQEDRPEDLLRWVLCWLAYPIQHPGAKMKTALVMHGPQGAGKNMFFEAVMAIYGEYGRIVDQSAVEDKFNDWASKKLFMIADEVVARQELYHVKNKLKHLITGDWIRINPKNVAAHDERNHVNLVFLSNETQPLVLEKDDRRYTVIWTPEKLSPELYVEVAEEIAAGGIAALHDFLLTYDLGDFKPHTNPPDTQAKRDLIEISTNSDEDFMRHWFTKEIEGIPVVPCRSEDLYDLYKPWCARVGIKNPVPKKIMMGKIGKRTDCKKSIERYYIGTSEKQATFITPPGAGLPPGENQKAWFTKGYEAFATGISEWKSS